MTDEKWQKINDIFDVALQLNLAQRQEYVKHACGDDAELFSEAESLLENADNTDFMKDAAVCEVADVIVEESKTKTVLKGQQISHYKILSEIGKGGMGEVYLAQDTKLNRKVALKILPADFTNDVERMSRFVREAQSASALNHPNIITIYEINEIDNLHFISTEYIKGETLSEYLKAKPTKISSILDIAIQIASALDDAHAAGIVHRDIKPDNIMIRKSEFVKILDFGIAKLTEKQTSEIESEDTVAIRINTTSGMIIGTPNYMSPEQAKGKQVDERTDIFSFGVVIYEMIAGRTPFAGDSVSETISNLINIEPHLLSRFAADVPDELQRIVSKMLRKDKNERYQTIKGLLADLKHLRENLVFDKRLEKLHPPDASNKTKLLRTATGETNFLTAHTQNSFSQKIKRHQSPTFAVLTMIIAVLAVGSYFAFFAPHPPITSIAVLPFVNGSNDANLDYLSDGMTETLISSLSNIPNLSVKARSTVFYYKGKNISPKKIGEELGVESVLLGRLVQRGDDVKLNLELVDTTNQNVIWSENYDRKMSEIVSLQKEIAKNISNELQRKLSGEEENKADKIATTNPEAYQANLKGRFFWNKRSEEDIKKGIEYFNKAIELDPGYAPAWSGLADSYLVLPSYSNTKYKDIVGKIETAATKAIELDPTFAEPYTSLATLKSITWKFDEAEKLFKKSIEIDPTYATARKWYALHLARQKRFDEAIRESRKSVELAPFSKTMYYELAHVLLMAKKYDEAIKQVTKGIELYPDFLGGYYQIRGDAYRHKGMEAEAFEDYVKELELVDTEQELLSKYKKAYKDGGFKAARVVLAKEDIKDDRSKHFSRSKYFSKAVSYAMLKNKEKAIENLYKAYEDREPESIDMDFIDEFEILRDDPRYKEWKRKIGVPE